MLQENVTDVLAGVFVITAGSVVTCLLVKWIQQRKTKQKIEVARAERKRALQQMEQAVQQVKEEKHAEDSRMILSLSACELSEKLKDGSLSPEAVLYTFMEKALEVNKEVNCVTDFFQECEAQIQEVKKQKAKGLLYGVPVSLKDSVCYKGHVSTCGMSFFLGKAAKEDSVIVQVLKKQGAIPFVATNIPQTMMHFDCSNPIYGQSLNPLNHTKSPGGSSGGEGALIAGGGSVLGIGTDIGGSIRLPCSFCGICGLKPTSGRLSLKGTSDIIPGINYVLPSIGPMALDVDSLALCMKALLCEELFQLDPEIPPMPFNSQVYNSTNPLRIGYFECDGHMQALPSMRRAVRETIQLLQEAGHTLIPFPVTQIDYVFNDLYLKGVFADGLSSLLDSLKGDIIDPHLSLMVSVIRLPTFVKKMLAFICSFLDYCQKFISEWKKHKLDVLLCPSLSPAFSIGYPSYTTPSLSYTTLFNVLDFPAGIVPVTKVTQEDEEELKNYKGFLNDYVDKMFRQAVQGGVGLPVAVQCVALPWQEELCLRFMKEVEELSCKKRK
ncbi:fatty-acid amide hydrolase 1 isoform X2 [Protopterus annectens]|uniref:fatty-acid amide hydrolase 1 isoform X2 n=1 Tax=Protopterus annectens TaxID=7888 RepID=UPI001CFBF685|nr:fatty-acid amide hydrolase 1 isoform X2 [Protopterus annectens]